MSPQVNLVFWELNLKTFMVEINGTARFFAFSLIIEGTTEKVLQFTMPLKSINDKNLCFDQQKMYF